MKKLLSILKMGWIIEEMRFDKHQGFFYLSARHDSQEASVEVSNDLSFDAAVIELCFKAKTATPAWYLAQLKAEIRV